MIKDQKFGKRRAASFQNPESTIQNLESSDAVEGYRERAVAIRIFTERIGLQVIPIGRSCPGAPGQEEQIGILQIGKDFRRYRR